MTRSRLRSPTSKSTTQTYCPVCARAAPIAAVDVVFPTPPLPEVTTTTLPMVQSSRSIQNRNCQFISCKLGLHGASKHAWIHFIRRFVGACDRDQFGFEPAAEDACSSKSIHPRYGATAQRPVNVDRAA